MSWKSYSDSTPLCSDSDCTFEHCKAAKRSNDEKQRLTHRADDSTQYDAPSKHLNFYTLRDDIRNRETVPRSFKFIPSVPHRNPAFVRVPPGFEWKDVHFSKCVQQIPPHINRETRLGLNDVQLFANVMRAGRRNIGEYYLIEKKYMYLELIKLVSRLNLLRRWHRSRCVAIPLEHHRNPSAGKLPGSVVLAPAARPTHQGAH